jgi:hypothetical protein
MWTSPKRPDGNEYLALDETKSCNGTGHRTSEKGAQNGSLHAQVGRSLPAAVLECRASIYNHLRLKTTSNFTICSPNIPKCGLGVNASGPGGDKAACRKGVG